MEVVSRQIIFLDFCEFVHSVLCEQWMLLKKFSLFYYFATAPVLQATQASLNETSEHVRLKFYFELLVFLGFVIEALKALCTKRCLVHLHLESLKTLVEHQL